MTKKFLLLACISSSLFAGRYPYINNILQIPDATSLAERIGACPAGKQGIVIAPRIIASVNHGSINTEHPDQICIQGKSYTIIRQIQEGGLGNRDLKLMFLDKPIEGIEILPVFKMEDAQRIPPASLLHAISVVSNNIALGNSEEKVSIPYGLSIPHYGSLSSLTLENSFETLPVRQQGGQQQNFVPVGGDSGSPCFISQNNGSLATVGVVSTIGDDKGTNASYTYIGKHLDWINEVIERYYDANSKDFQIKTVDLSACNLESQALPLPTIEGAIKKIKGDVQKGIAFNTDAIEVNFENIQGLSGIEPWGRWSDTKQVILTTQQDLPKSFLLELTASPFGDNENNEMVIYINDIPVGVIDTTKTNGDDFQRTLRITHDQQGARIIKFDIPNPQRPSDSDQRTIGIGFKNIRISPIQNISFFKENGLSDALERTSGLSGYETWGRWSYAKNPDDENDQRDPNDHNVVFTFKNDLPQNFTLRLKCSTYGDNAGKNMPAVINNQIVGNINTTHTSDNLFEQEIQINNIPSNSRSIVFTVPNPQKPDNGDTRRLGIGFIEMDIIAK